MLGYIPNHFKTQGMCERTVEENLWSLVYVPDQYKTQEMCEKAVKDEPYILKYVPDHFKTQKMCYKAVKNDPSFLQSIPDWFITKEWIDMWYDVIKINLLSCMMTSLINIIFLNGTKAIIKARPKKQK